MKRTVKVRSCILTSVTALGVVLVGCSAAQQSKEDPDSTSIEDKLIGGVPANSSRLDAVGAIGVEYTYDGGFGGGFAGTPGKMDPTQPSAGRAGAASVGYTWFSPQCTGTLVGPNAVLTSQGCASILDHWWAGENATVRFAIGANGGAPERTVEVVDVEYAPGGSDYTDLAVLHLAEAITDVAPLAPAALPANSVGEQFAAVGYGVRDLRSLVEGQRRAGAVTVRGVEGRTYELIFGSFEAFYEFHGGGGLGGRSGVGGSPAGSVPGMGGSSIAGSLPVAGSTPGGGPGEAGAGGSAGKGGDWYEEYLRTIYEQTLLPSTQLLTGGPRDAQPCGIDMGGPLARYTGGELLVHGVFLQPALWDCSHGGFYTRLTPELVTWIQSTLDWVDPCAGITRAGHCEGSVATRCATRGEGERRIVEFDCALLGQSCSEPLGSEVACVDPAD